MLISLPPIGSRYFPLYWGLISFASLIICTVLIWMIPSAVVSLGFPSKLIPADIYRILLIIQLCSYFFCLNALPIMLLKPHLKWRHKAEWIASKSIAQLAFGIGIFWISLCSSFDIFDRTGQMKPSRLDTLYGCGVYQVLAVLTIVWVIASVWQISAIPFKYPKRWLISNILNWIMAYLFFCWLMLLNPSDSPLAPVMLILYGILKPGLTGLGLYFSGMGIKK